MLALLLFLLSANKMLYEMPDHRLGSAIAKTFKPGFVNFLVVFTSVYA